MISTKGCGVELILYSFDFRTNTASQIEVGDWYPVSMEHPGQDTFVQTSRGLYCGATTLANKYMRLCDLCARKEGLKW
jgi:hypothetical protein